MDQTEIYLDKITYSDTFDIVNWRNQEHVQSKFIFREKFTVEMHNNWMKNRVETGQVAQFIIKLKENNRPIGSVFLKDIDMSNKKAEFGIFIGDEEYIGKGIGGCATRLILDYAFYIINLHKVYLRVLALNTRAIGSYEKSGFVKEGYFKDEIFINGTYSDIIFMSIISNRRTKL